MATIHNQYITEQNKHGESPQSIPIDTENLFHKNSHRFGDIKKKKKGIIKSGTEGKPRLDNGLSLKTHRALTSHQMPVNRKLSS